MANQKSHRYCTVTCRLPTRYDLTDCSGKGGEIKKLDTWGAVNNKGYSSIQSLLKEIYQEYKKAIFWGGRGGLQSLKNFIKFLWGKQSSISWNIKSSVSWNIKNFLGGFHFPKNKKSFLLRKYEKFFNFRARKFHFQKFWEIKEFSLSEDFFIFQALA